MVVARRFDYLGRTVVLHGLRQERDKNLKQESRLTEQIHVWVYGPDQREVERLTEYLGGLELFREKPKDTIVTR